MAIGPGFNSTSSLNNTKRHYSQKEVFSGKPIRKRNKAKSFMELLSFAICSFE